MIYKMEWKATGRIKADAGKVGEEIESLGSAITAKDVVKKAEDATTELNKCFEWDNEKAAGSYRIDQARYLLRMLIIVPADDDEEELPQEIIRAYESVKTEGGRVYMPIERILDNKDWREEIFTEIRSSIDELLRKLEVYEHMSGIGRNMFKVKEILKKAGKLVGVESG